jgi:putative flippase GtrA
MLFDMLMVVIFLLAFMHGREHGAPFVGAIIGITCAFLFDFGNRLTFKETERARGRLAQWSTANKKVNAIARNSIDCGIVLFFLSWLFFMLWFAWRVTECFLSKGD